MVQLLPLIPWNISKLLCRRMTKRRSGHPSTSVYCIVACGQWMEKMDALEKNITMIQSALANTVVISVQYIVMMIKSYCL